MTRSDDAQHTPGDRLLSPDVHSGELAPLDAGEGAPRTAWATLGELSGTGVGVWEMHPGTATDTEVDEVFLVLAGDGEVAFDDGTTLQLRPGVLVRLHAGDRTRWSVRSTLRKLWVSAT